MVRFLASRWTQLAIVALLIAVPGMLISSGYFFRVGALVWVSAIAVIGLNLLLGYAGQVSLGHAGFFGIGAYAVAVLPARFGIDTLLALVIGALVSGGLAFLVGRPILRLKGHFLAVATLGLGILAWIILTNEIPLTGGPDGMPVKRLELFGTRLRTPEVWYWISGGTLLLAMLLAQNLMASPTGRALRALHDSEMAARVIGINAARYKVVVFTVSAVYAAVAGSYFALLNGYVTPQVADFIHSVELVTMVVVGGMGSILGSILGAAILVILPQALTVFKEYEHLMLGAFIIVMMIFLRDGLVPGLARIFQPRAE